MATASRNHALWLGPLLALVGFLSYYTVFFWWPITRDIPWVNLILLAGAVALSVRAVTRAWSGGTLRRVAAGAGVLWSGGLTALLVFYAFFLSYGLPSADLALKVGASLPQITLVDQNGQDFDLARDGGEKLVLVFYRGDW